MGDENELCMDIVDTVCIYFSFMKAFIHFFKIFRQIIPVLFGVKVISVAIEIQMKQIVY